VDTQTFEKPAALKRRRTPVRNPLAASGGHSARQTIKKDIMKKIVVLLILIFTLTSCKKEKLTGDNSKFVGTWTWYNGWWANNPNFKLVIVDKGKYKLFGGDDKIDYGRLLEKNGVLTFISDKPRHKGYFSNGDYQLTFINTDTIGVGNSSIRDFPSSAYVRQK
jgi:hypothetical protein